MKKEQRKKLKPKKNSSGWALNAASLAFSHEHLLAVSQLVFNLHLHSNGKVI